MREALNDQGRDAGGVPAAPGAAPSRPLAELSPPEPLIANFTAALLARDPERATACFSPDGTLLTPDATEVSGRRAITGVLAQLDTSSLRLALEPGRTLRAGRVAVCTSRLVLTSVAAGLEPFERSFASLLVLNHDGKRWWIQFAAPWGL